MRVEIPSNERAGWKFEVFDPSCEEMVLAGEQVK
jgi:hypothetical protein